MIGYALFIWVGLVVKMPAGYFVACCLGITIKMIRAILDSLDEKA